MHPLVKARRIAAVSQRELAEMSGVGQTTIARIENGLVKEPHPKTIRQMAEALGVTPLSLFEPEQTEKEEVSVG